MQPYREMLKRQEVKQSISRKGNCCGNAVFESLFGTLKAEYFQFAAPNSIDALEGDLSNLRLIPTAQDISNLKADGYLRDVIAELRDLETPSNPQHQ